MDHTAFLTAALLGLVEGLTEFLPVSSTGHLILVDDLLGFQGPSGQVFEIVIQLGAILAVCVLYWRRLTHVAIAFTKERTSQLFVINVLLAFLPAMVLGAFLHDFIKSVLFSPWVVCVALVLGGFAILYIERIRPRPMTMNVDSITPLLALKIGFCQCLALIPGVSRAGATIMGAVMLRVDRAPATEFSFFLAIPTMFAATVYDVYKNRDALTTDDAALIAIGFVVAFLSALVVVKTLVGFVSRNGFAPFAYYRIIIGVVMGAILLSR